MRALIGVCAFAAVAHADPQPDVELRAMVTATTTSVDSTSGTGFGAGFSLAKRVSSDTFVGLQANFTSYTDSSAMAHQLLQMHAIVEVHLEPVTISLGLGFDHYVIDDPNDFETTPEWLVGAHVQLTVPIVRQGPSAMELVVNAGVSPIIDVPDFAQGTTADVVSSVALGIAYRYL